MQRVARNVEPLPTLKKHLKQARALAAPGSSSKSFRVTRRPEDQPSRCCDGRRRVVVGAGVVGLAVARALALGGRRVVVLERERAVGTAVSSRNSGVIHAGVYYAPDN